MMMQDNRWVGPTRLETIEARDAQMEAACGEDYSDLLKELFQTQSVEMDERNFATE